MTEFKENLLPPVEDISVDDAAPLTLIADEKYHPVITDMTLDLPAGDVPIINTSTTSARSPSLTASPKSTSSAQALADIIAEIHLLSKENRLLEAIIIRNTPADDNNSTIQENQHEDDDDDDNTTTTTATNSITNNNINDKTTIIPTSIDESLPTLSLAERCDLVIDELVYRRTQSSSLQTKFLLDLELLDSITSAITSRIGSLRKEAFSFQREVCMNGLNRDGYVRADIIIQWCENIYKNKMNEVNHLNSKINTLKQSIHKQENNSGNNNNKNNNNNNSNNSNNNNNNNNNHDSLHSIDFHQLQIKNTQFTTKIKEKNQTLLTLKLSTGKAVHRLTEAKKILSQELNKTTNLIKEMSDRTRQLSRLSDEKIRIENELLKSKKKTLTYQCVVSNPNMPTVMDYVLLKKNLHELCLRKKELIRKNEIMKGREKCQLLTIRRQTRAFTAPSTTNITSSSMSYGGSSLSYNENTGMTSTRPFDNRLPRI